MTTDTPRTDALIMECPSHLQEVALSNLAMDLERELAAEIANRKKCCLDGNQISDELFDTQQKLKKAEAEVKEIRSALGDDGRRTHKELVELATKASEWRTWKQKYIDLKNAHIAEGQDPAGTIWEHADKLQKELAASKAEVELLKQGKVFVDPKWIYNLETQLAKAHEELCQAGLREYGN